MVLSGKQSHCKWYRNEELHMEMTAYIDREELEVKVWKVAAVGMEGHW